MRKVIHNTKPPFGGDVQSRNSSIHQTTNTKGRSTCTNEIPDSTRSLAQLSGRNVITFLHTAHARKDNKLGEKKKRQVPLTRLTTGFSAQSHEKALHVWNKKGATRRRRRPRGGRRSNSRFLLRACKKKKDLCQHKTPLSLPFFPPIYIYRERTLDFIIFFSQKSSSSSLTYGVCPTGSLRYYKENKLGRALVVK